MVDLMVDLRHDACAIQEVQKTVLAAYVWFQVDLTEEVSQRLVHSSLEVDKCPDYDLQEQDPGQIYVASQIDLEQCDYVSPG